MDIYVIVHTDKWGNKHLCNFYNTSSFCGTVWTSESVAKEVFENIPVTKGAGYSLSLHKFEV